MADNTQTTTTFANDTPTEWFRAELLERSDRYEVFTKYGLQVQLPSQQGDTVQFVRYERPTIPSGPLTEGVTPDGQSVSISKVTASVDQFGGYFTLSDTAILQTFHGPFEQVAELAAQQHGSVRDREAQRVVRRATNVYYAANRSARSSLTTSDYMTTGDAIRVLEGLRAKGAPVYNDGMYAVIIPTAVEADMLNDATWVNTKTQQDQGPLERGEVMRWMGGKFVRSNQIPSYTVSTSANPTVAVGATNNDTALTDATYQVSLVAVDRYGQEFATSDGTTSCTGVITGSDDVVTITTPAALTVNGITAAGYNIYVSTGAKGTERLQYRNAAASTAYRLSGNGAGTNGIAYSTSGQLIEPHPASGVTCHPVFFIGRGYFACISNGSVVTTMTAPTTSGRTSDSDPLGQRRKVGWKAWNKDCMLNENFGAVLWVASRYTGYQSV